MVGSTRRGKENLKALDRIHRHQHRDKQRRPTEIEPWGCKRGQQFGHQPRIALWLE
jgi:hypothetical protein